jgi:DNA-binding NarL/FixJ family response regulator
MSMPLARPRVLVADDHPEVAKSVCRLLALDYEVVGTVADGSALLEAVQRLAPDVVVLDVNLPTVHGLEACRQLRQMNPAMKVVVFSAMSETELSDELIASGASAFVSKLASGDLLATIKRLCAEPC